MRNEHAFPFIYRFISDYLSLHTPWFFDVYPILYCCISQYLLLHPPWLLLLSWWCIHMIYRGISNYKCYISDDFLLHIYDFFLHSPWFIAAISRVNRCFPFDLWLHSQLINGTFHIVYLCISIFSCCIPHDLYNCISHDITAFPIIYCSIVYNFFLRSLLFYIALLMIYCCIPYDL